MNSTTAPSAHALELVGGFPPAGDDGAGLTNASIGAAVRALRLAAGMRLEDLSMAVDIPLPNLSRIERGERLCKYAEMSRLADRLGVSSSQVREIASEIRRDLNPTPGRSAADAAVEIAAMIEHRRKSEPRRRRRSRTAAAA